jgi:hypothetical protein
VIQAPFDLLPIIQDRGTSTGEHLFLLCHQYVSHAHTQIFSPATLISIWIRKFLSKTSSIVGYLTVFSSGLAVVLAEDPEGTPLANPVPRTFWTFLLLDQLKFYNYSF